MPYYFKNLKEKGKFLDLYKPPSSAGEKRAMLMEWPYQISSYTAKQR